MITILENRNRQRERDVASELLAILARKEKQNATGSGQVSCNIGATFGAGILTSTVSMPVLLNEKAR
jgi:ribose 1,5-bisphosphokinase PhnN